MLTVPPEPAGAEAEDAEPDAEPAVVDDPAVDAAPDVAGAAAVDDDTDGDTDGDDALVDELPEAAVVEDEQATSEPVTATAVHAASRARRAVEE